MENVTSYEGHWQILESSMGIGLGIGLALILLTFYFLPSIIAFRRHKKNALAIFVLNLFLGVTFLGWVAAMVWSLMYEEKKSDD